MDNTVRGTIEMTAAMTIVGTIGWFVVMSGQPVMDVVFWRCAFGAVALLITCAALGLLRGRLTLRIVAIAALGGAAIVINWLLLFSAFSRASISIATAVYNTQPFMLVGFGALFFGERLTLAKLTWLGIAFAGMLLIVQTGPDAGVGSGITGTDYVIGIVMALGAAFFWAVAAIVAKKLKGTPPHLIALIQVCVGVVMLAPFANLSHLPADAWSWAMLATLGVVHTGLVYILMYAAIQKLPTHLQGSLSFIYPVVAILVDVMAFGHRLHPAQLVGAAAILVAAAGMNLGWTLWKAKPTVESPQAVK
ncbi:DMT family transporter [Mesorhizobium sp. M1148]|uniref:DMT family transporter n=1 Tax=unclassified Mesorhizobium TaxID=325217 RepID=UPI0003CE68D6|nr:MULTISPECIES: DMT family transporter [unclassified Mesorhizobium]ESW65954.1 multidrug DMT transporter permease [Mesorhizobium sp. LSJC277A00]ESY10916.1 multidrug DMT transporter permease [Mesorhizobium sp. LNJC398B00]ESY21358.1 multidrug DMT transporter permease [Mesorhizobium sp. LNJC394B00]ESY30253.1 multidrug DMT transporter permease [Mesorhizobium sp. LNJC391B00]ESY34531.1 multidrug DMT transporter permease [Mesorhizobium sp. LNJC386A00]